MVNRRMFRPGFPDVKEPVPVRPSTHTGSNGGPAPSKKPTPPELTHAENFYWIKQMQSRTPMVVVLEDGESLRGIIEWYDRDCIKLTREGAVRISVAEPGGSSRIFRNTLATSQRMVSAPSMIKTRRRPKGWK